MDRFRHLSRREILGILGHLVVCFISLALIPLSKALGRKIEVKNERGIR